MDIGNGSIIAFLNREYCDDVKNRKSLIVSYFIFNILKILYSIYIQNLYYVRRILWGD